MKHQRVAVVLLVLWLCLSNCFPTAFAAEQRAEVEGLTVKVRCTGSAIPTERLTVRLTPRDDAPMPDDAEELTVTLDTADCKASRDHTASAEFPGTFVYTTPGQYEYEVRQEKGTASHGTYDTRTLIVRVTARWNEGTFGCVVKVLEDGAPSDTKKEEICFNNRYTRADTPEPPYVPIDPPPCPDPGKPSTPSAPSTPTAPPVVTPEPPLAAEETPQPEPTVTVIPAAAKPAGETLIQTGQLNWPVPVLTGAGALLLAMGLWTRKRSRNDEDA